MESEEINAGEAHNFPAEMGSEMLEISRQQLDQLLALLTELKADVISLVQVFHLFSGLFDGNAGIGKIIASLPRMMKDKALQEKLATVLPIIEKYTVTTENNEQKA